MEILANLREDLIAEIRKEATTEAEAKRMIDIMEIALARIATRMDTRKVPIDERVIPEIQESIRIGAKIEQKKAIEILDRTLGIIRSRNEPKVRVFDEGTFEIEGDKVSFRSEDE